MRFTIKQLAYDYGYSIRTLHRRLAELRKNNTFVKTSKGKLFNQTEAQEIANLLGFTIKKLKNENTKTSYVNPPGINI